MKLKFKVQPYQTAAVEAVRDCFKGQPPAAPVRYRIDPGSAPAPEPAPRQAGMFGDQRFATIRADKVFRADGDLPA